MIAEVIHQRATIDLDCSMGGMLLSLILRQTNDHVFMQKVQNRSALSDSKTLQP